MTRGYLVDANVLIDYQKSDLAILEMYSTHVSQIHALTTTVEEVDGLGIDECSHHGVKVMKPESRQLACAARERGRLSFEDRLCLIVAADKNFACVSNDRALRKACSQENVARIWGLTLMKKLVEVNAISSAKAIEISRAIHRNNPFHIPENLVVRFSEHVTKLSVSPRLTKQ